MIEERFEGKNYNEETIKYLNNFLYEFDALFGIYVSREEVIRRIKENLDESFIYRDDFPDRIYGTYHANKKTIELRSDLDPGLLKSVIFHELIHCITARGKDTGFCREYSSEDFDRSVFIGRGINEGTAEYLTQLRDKRFAQNIKKTSYPVLVQNVKYIMDIVGEESLINAFFNEPENIVELIYEGFNYEDESDVYDFIRNLDFILKHEKDLAVEISIKKSLKLPVRIIDKKVKSTVEIIIEDYCNGYLEKNISNMEDYIRIYDQLQELMGLYDILDIRIFESLIQKSYSLLTPDFSHEDMLNKLPEDISYVFQLNDRIDELEDMDIKQRLITISTQYSNLLDRLQYDDYGIVTRLLKTKMVHLLYIDNSFENFDDICVLAQHILDNNYNFNNLSVQIFENEEDTRELIYCLYQGIGEDCRQIGMLRYDLKSNEISEMKTVDFSRKKELTEQYGYEVTEDDEIYEDSLGNIVIKGENGEFIIRSGSTEEIIPLEITGYIKSNCEALWNRKNALEHRIKRLEGINAPDVMIKKDKRLLEIVEEDIRRIMNEGRTINKDEESEGR